MGMLVDNTAGERNDIGHPWRVVARGILDMTAGGGAGAWIGRHPGFADAITDNGAGDQTVHLAAAGAATMVGCVFALSSERQAGALALAGATLQDLQVLCRTWNASDSNPGGWGAGAHLPATAALADGVVLIEVVDTTVD